MRNSTKVLVPKSETNWKPCALASVLQRDENMLQLTEGLVVQDGMNTHWEKWKAINEIHYQPYKTCYIRFNEVEISRNFIIM